MSRNEAFTATIEEHLQKHSVVESLEKFTNQNGKLVYRFSHRFAPVEIQLSNKLGFYKISAVLERSEFAINSHTSVADTYNPVVFNKARLYQDSVASRASIRLVVDDAITMRNRIQEANAFSSKVDAAVNTELESDAHGIQTRIYFAGNAPKDSQNKKLDPHPKSDNIRVAVGHPFESGGFCGIIYAATTDITGDAQLFAKQTLDSLVRDARENGNRLRNFYLSRGLRIQEINKDEILFGTNYPGVEFDASVKENPKGSILRPIVDVRKADSIANAPLSAIDISSELKRISPGTVQQLRTAQLILDRSRRRAGK